MEKDNVTESVYSNYSIIAINVEIKPLQYN